MTSFQFFVIVADAAIIANEAITGEMLSLLGMDRSQFPKPWPLVADNLHGTLAPVHVRTALAMLDDADGQHEKFAAGWCEWLGMCLQPLNTPESVARMIADAKEELHDLK